MQVASHTTLTVTNAKQASTNNNFAFTVAVTSSGASPTGQVQLFDGSTALGLPVTVSNGTASINTGLATVGTHAVSAHYLGNATTLASASGALNVTVTGPSATDSYLTVWPDAVARPGTSDLNFTLGRTAPNLVVVQIGATGAVDFYNAAGSVNVIGDVMGWYG